MFWPLLLATSTTAFGGLADMQVSGTIGAASQAVVGLSEAIFAMFGVLIGAVGEGTTAVVARAVGSGEHEQAAIAGGQSALLGLVLGIASLCLAPVACMALLPFFGDDQTVLTQAPLYVSMLAMYFVPFSLMQIITAILRALGDSRAPLYMMLGFTVLQIAGDYALVLWNWPIPHLGVVGIAVSLWCASMFALAIGYLRLRKSALPNICCRLLPIDTALVYRILRIGGPAAVYGLNGLFFGLVLYFVLSRCPAAVPAIAAWTVGIRIESVLFMPVFAMQMAVATIVGQNLGARHVKRAFEAGWKAALMSFLLLTVLSVIVFFGADILASIMSHDALTRSYIKYYVCIAALVGPAVAVQMALTGALFGAGDTRTPMVVSVLFNWFVNLPLAWILALTVGLGPAGAFMAKGVATVLETIVIGCKYGSKRWVRLKI